MKRHLILRFVRFALVFTLFQKSTPQEAINPDQSAADAREEVSTYPLPGMQMEAGCDESLVLRRLCVP